MLGEGPAAVGCSVDGAGARYVGMGRRGSCLVREGGSFREGFLVLSGACGVCVYVIVTFFERRRA